MMKFGAGPRQSRCSYSLFDVRDRRGKLVKVRAINKTQAKRIMAAYDNQEPIKKRSR